MKVYITTTVNFGDKPAGCIAIAAAREMAAMDEGEFREAAWFLQNRTYVDDATPGADSMDHLTTSQRRWRPWQREAASSSRRL